MPPVEDSKMALINVAQLIKKVLFQVGNIYKYIVIGSVMLICTFSSIAFFIIEQKQVSSLHFP